MVNIFSHFFLVIIGLALVITSFVSGEIPENEDIRDLITLTGPEEVIIGDKILLSGTVDSSLYGSNPSDVIVLITAPEGSHADSFMLAKPTINGSFHYNQVADVGGDWVFEALYSGIYSNKFAIEAIPGDEPKITALTLSGWPTFPKIGEYVSFKGRLSDSEGKGIGLKPVNYRLASSPFGCLGGCGFEEDLEWRDAGIITTDMNGEYSFRLPVVENGSVQIETSFSGDEGYSPSSSRALKITVQDE